MALDPATVDVRRSHLARQAEQRLALGPAWQSRQVDWRGEAREALVFTWEDGSLIHPDRFSRWFHQHGKARVLQASFCKDAAGT